MEATYTVFEYLYRDAGNYKAWGSLLLSGAVSPEVEATFRDYLDSREFFVAEQVGIPPLNRNLWELSDGPIGDDHGFHEFHRFRPATAEDLTEPVWGNVKSLFQVFEKVQVSAFFTSL
jgi:hypothetical protein